MLEPGSPLPTGTRQALAELGRELRAAGYTEAAVAGALGLPGWTAAGLDQDWWTLDNRAEGRLGVLVDLFVRGEVLPEAVAERALPSAAWRSGLLVARRGEVRADCLLVPMGPGLVCTDRGDHSFTRSGLFVPDSSTLFLLRCLPEAPVGRHLDLGAGAGAIAACSGAGQVVAVEPNPRGGVAIQRSAALSGAAGVGAWTGSAAEAAALGSFDLVSFVLPILVPWNGMSTSAPGHTLSTSPGLLAEVLGLLPRLLAPGGLALLYCQDWVGGGPLIDAVRAALGDRAGRGVFWWDADGTWRGHRVRTGVLALRADAGPGWTEARLDAPDQPGARWWPALSALLG